MTINLRTPGVDDPNEEVPQHAEEKEFDPLPKAVKDLEPDYTADQVDEVSEETVDDIPEDDLPDAADSEDPELKDEEVK
jgi:hypothetical protein